MPARRKRGDWPTQEWAVSARAEILERARRVTEFSNLALEQARHSAKNFYILRVFLRQIGNEVRAICVAVVKFRAKQLEESPTGRRGKLPIWISDIMTITDAVDREEKKRLSAYWWALEVDKKINKIDFNNLIGSEAEIIDALGLAGRAGQTIEMMILSGPGPQNPGPQNIIYIGNPPTVKTTRKRNNKEDDYIGD